LLFDISMCLSFMPDFVDGWLHASIVLFWVGAVLPAWPKDV